MSNELQEYLQTVDNVVVDIGASNVEDLLALMRKYRGSHEDFDYFVIPTVPALKQQQDTIATLTELARLGIPAAKLRVVFNQVEDGAGVRRIPLITGEDEAGHLQAAPSGHGLGRCQVSPERGLVLPGFEAVVVGEGVRSDFLSDGAPDQVDQ